MVSKVGHDHLVKQVPSCSTASATRRRRNEEFDETENCGIKIPRGTFNFVLEPESDLSSSEDDTESILSIQNKSTDLAKDTSDTSSKMSFLGSDFEVEYEVVSLSDHDQDHPFLSYSSGTDLEECPIRKTRQEKETSSEESLMADSSSEPEDQPVELISLKSRICLRCKAPTAFIHFCHRCHKIRKDLFPPRPKRYKRNKSKSVPKKKSTRDKPKLLIGEDEDKNDSGLGSSSSQEIVLTCDEYSKLPQGYNLGLCKVCLINPINAIFAHCKWAHFYACYRCSIKIGFTSRCCPSCNRKFSNILKIPSP